MIPIEGVLDKYGVEYDPSKDGNQKVLCPFHLDTHPSASVNLGLGVFNCFGNQSCPGGDAIELLREREGLDFIEAKRLAEELAGEARPAVSRESHTGGFLLPRKSGTVRGGNPWKSPWASS